MEDHVVKLIGDYVREHLEDHSPFRILSVGSGDGGNDLVFLDILSSLLGGKDKKVEFVERVIEPDQNKLAEFRAKAEHLPDSLKSRADVEFVWHGMTYQEYVEQKKKDDVKSDVVHFIHSLYYTDLETTLEHCYEKELGTKGVILCILTSEDSAIGKYGRIFSSQGIILNSGAYYTDIDVKGVAEKNGWKYIECAGESKACDLTAIFNCSSQEGNHLLDFLTHWAYVRATASEDNLMEILNFWENECVKDHHGKKLVNWNTKTIIILKGM